MTTRTLGLALCVGADATFRHHVASDSVLLTIITADSVTAATLHLSREGAEALVIAASKALVAASALKPEHE